MSPNDASEGGGGVEGRTRREEARRLTPSWLKTTLASNRLEFEREMQRNRDGFAQEFERF